MKATIVKTAKGVLDYSLELRQILGQFDGQEVLIEVSKVPLKRSERQNKYYFAIVVPHFQKIWKEVIGGLTKDMTHEMLKHNFLPLDIPSPKSGEMVRICRSTSDLSTKEFSDYIDACRAYYRTETGEILPLPRFLDYREK